MTTIKDLFNIPAKKTPAILGTPDTPKMDAEYSSQAIK
jgi:hypothetical protein